MNDIIQLGRTISFIPAYTGAVTVIGVVTGIVDYSVATSFGDIQANHASVRMMKPQIDNIENLEFFTLRIDGKTSVFSDAWITEGTLNVVEVSKYVDLRIYDVDLLKLPELRAYLQTGGYLTIKLLSSSL